MSEQTAEKDAAFRCEGTCDYCRPDAWHECTLPAGHEGYHSCTGYVLPPASTDPTPAADGLPGREVGP